MSDTSDNPMNGRWATLYLTKAGLAAKENDMSDTMNEFTFKPNQPKVTVPERDPVMDEQMRKLKPSHYPLDLPVMASDYWSGHEAGWKEAMEAAFHKVYERSNYIADAVFNNLPYPGAKP